jgi:hypothetical protein
MVTDSVYVLINVLDAEEDLRDALVEFARAVSERAGNTEPPDVFGALPAKGRIPASERVVRGPYTLEPLYTLGEGDILNLGGEITAIAASYVDEAGTRFTRILVPYPSPDRARSAFEHLRDHLDPYLEVLAGDDDSLVFEDYRDRYGKVVQDGSRIEITADLLEPPQLGEEPTTG